MAAESIVCGTCTAAVPYGRLSCPSCGELLASVAGARRAAGRTGRSALPEVLYEADAAPSAAVADGQLSLPSTTRDLDAELPWMTATSDAGDPVPAAGAIDDDEADPEEADPEEADAGEPEGPTDDVDLALDTDGGWSVGGPTWTPGTTSLTGSPTPSYLPRPGLGPAPAPTYGGPGAYVPPMPVAMAAAGPTVPARAWAGLAPAMVAPAPVEAPSMPDVRVAVAATGSVAASHDASSDRRARFAEFVGWLSVAGAAFTAVGFLLPWGAVMIGASGVGYFDRWGLAGPAHILLVLGLLAVLVLAFVTNPIPVWIRTGLVGLGLGALVFGLVWPYLLGPLGSGPGVLIVAVGSVVLAVSGILALIADRHAEVDPAV